MKQTALVLKAGGNTGLGMWTGLRRGEATKPMPKTELEGQRKWGSTRPVLETEGWKVRGVQCSWDLFQMLLHLIIQEGQCYDQVSF